MKSIALAAALALAFIAAPALAETPPTASRVFKLCYMEDPSCGRLIWESVARVEAISSPCPAGRAFPHDIIALAYRNEAADQLGHEPFASIDTIVALVIRTIPLNYCR